MSECDQEALCLAPDGWFDIYSMNGFIKRRAYRCARLKEQGMLEMRVAGTFPALWWEYRRTPAADAWVETPAARALTDRLKIAGATKS